MQVSAVVGDGGGDVGKHFFAFHVQLASFAHFPFVGTPVQVSAVVGGDGGGPGDGAAVSQIRHDAGHRCPVSALYSLSSHQPNDASSEQL